MLPVDMKVFEEDGADVESQQRGRADPRCSSDSHQVLCVLQDKRFGVLTAVNIRTAVAKFRGKTGASVFRVEVR
jgi:hypothetical protein